MSSELINELYKLVDLIKESSEYKQTKAKEKEMEEDEEFLMFSNAFINNQNDYNYQIQLGIDADTLELSKSKERLFSLKKVEDYNASFSSLKDLLNEIADKLLEGVFYESGRR